MREAMRGTPGRVLLLLVVVALVLGICAPRVAGSQTASAAAPADPALEARVRQLSAELRCPVCQGLSLADSPSELSQEMKDVVRAQLAAGRTAEQVKAYFVARYGEWILLQPPARGLNLLVYALPVMLVVTGLCALVYVGRRWTRNSSPTPPVPNSDVRTS